jgi:hypothetical protein
VWWAVVQVLMGEPNLIGRCVFTVKALMLDAPFKCGLPGQGWMTYGFMICDIQL